MSRALASKLGWSALVSGSLPRVVPAAEGAGRVITERQATKVEEAKVAQQLQEPAKQLTVHQTLLKTFDLHIGATLPLPTTDKRKTHNPEPLPTPGASLEGATSGSVLTDPFAGLPFRNLAEKLGAHMAPALEQLRADKRKARAVDPAVAAAAVELLPVPHLLPFTRWASQSEIFKSTLIAEDPKIRKKARLSWYHPDDTMVPRGWWKGGLLADLAYYKPFSREA
ncbi:hypothetical protein WJX74_006228 [Apatococcus lobatus]|uniref:Uncharacterized protein n=1 Tax=Apatococcus lobatus TaxID=904363 RepID=A0AAW1SB30_9CHLO